MAKPGPKKRHTGMFKPGQSGNPSGPTRLLPECKELEILSGPELKRKIARCFRMRTEELQSVYDNPDEQVLHKCIAKQMLLAQNGMRAEFEALLNRAVGKVKETMEIIRPEPIIIKRLDGTEVELSTKDEDVYPS